jgi:hypothetical protein
MTTRTAGKIEADFCDQCGVHCETSVITVKLGGRKEHYCSLTCFDEYRGIPDRVALEIEKQARKECGKMHKIVCPKCTSRLNKFFEETECAEDS